MKNKVLIVLSLLAISHLGLSIDIYTRKVDKARTGYAKVASVSFTNVTGGTTTSIGCGDPGSLACPTIYNDGSGNDMEAAAQQIGVGIAHSQIGSGIYTGSQVYNSSGKRFEVRWVYDSTTTGERIEIEEL